MPPADLSRLPPEVAERCAGTVGDWCGQYLMQVPIPAKVMLCMLLWQKAPACDLPQLVCLRHRVVSNHRQFAVA